MRRCLWKLLVSVCLLVYVGPRALFAQPTPEPPAPQPTAAIQTLLDEINGLAQGGKQAEALATLEGVLQVAQGAKDLVGVARSLRVRARLLSSLGRDAEAVASWRETAQAWERVGDGPGRVEALGQAGALLLASMPEEARPLLSQAIELGKAETKRRLAAATSLNDIGSTFFLRGRLDEAKQFFELTLAIRENLAPDSLAVAASLNNLGNVAYKRGDLAAAENYYKRSLAIKEKLAPDSLAVAASLNNLGTVAGSRGDLALAEAYFKRGLALKEKLAPNSLEVANSLINLGTVATLRGDLAGGEDYLKRGLALTEKLAPDSLTVAVSLNNLGSVAHQRGDQSSAEDYFKRGLALREKLAPDSIHVAESLYNLGHVASDRGDLAASEDYFKRSLALREKLAPNSLFVANSLSSLGTLAYVRGDLAASEDYFKQSLALTEKLAPDSLTVAGSLNNLGSVAHQRGDQSSAEDYFKRGLALKEKLAPNSLEVANSLINLGALAFVRGDLAASEDYFKRSLALREKLAPNSLDVAESLQALGEVFLRQQHPHQALPLLIKAAQIVENQRGHIASNEARTLFLEKHNDTFTLLQRTYLALNKPADAFHTLQRGAARSLADRIAEGNLDFARAAPSELLKRQQELDNQRRIAYTSRARLDPNDKADAPKIRDLDDQIAKLAVQQRLLEADIRQQSPAFAAFVYPNPLDLPTTQRLLDPGTLLLAYAVDKEVTYLFTVTRNTFHVYKLPLKEKDLRLKLRNFHVALANPNTTNYLAQAKALYEQLLKPAQKEIAAATRLLLCPTGPLHTLAFAALYDDDDKRYLVQQKPLHTIASLNAFQELRRRARERKAGAIPALAIGDPTYPGGEVALSDSQKRFETMGGGKLARLRMTGDQAKAIARIYGPQTVMLLGDQATRSAVLAKAGEARLLHFGCHGLLDNGDPLASALALTAEKGKDDGMLRAYEVLTGMRLKADLVMLSACQTGLGLETKQEGIVGMTRAFEYAGAQSVVVSLWEIREDSATALVSNLYGGLKGGKSKDAALQLAQLSLLRNPLYKHPYHWAAYVLTGDWR